MKYNSVTIAIGALLLLIFATLLFVFQVRTTEVAVITTFGRPTRNIETPGAYAKWPWPIQKVHKVDQRVHNFESFEQVLTSDGFNLLLSVYVGWNINDPKLFFPRFGGAESKAQMSLEGLVRNAYSGVVGRHPFSHFVSAEEKELQFSNIENEMLQRIQADVQANNYGIQIKFLGIKKIQLPESVTKLVFERMQSERKVLVSRIENEGEREASTIRSAADLESQKLLAEAEADATRIRGLGDLEAAKSYEAFKQEPALANYLLQLAGLENFLKERATLILDLDTAPLNLLKDPNIRMQK
ncbi:MAG TPA: protease modulator HflC [Verrucomicrobiae bacterium]|nr:protease modulator HflC [Verrucomicrobiae bacterium]